MQQAGFVRDAVVGPAFEFDISRVSAQSSAFPEPDGTAEPHPSWRARSRYHEYREPSCENSIVPDDLVRRIAERFSPDKIILFGSSARGDAGPGSDIDLLVLFSEVGDPHKRTTELYASLMDFPRPMDIVVSTSSRFERYRNVVNTVYWPASREGKVLYERAA